MRRPAPLPPSLPPRLDAAVEAWWRLGLRTRLATAGVVALVVVALAASGRGGSSWGPAVAVLVASDDLPAGAALDGAAIVRAERPAAVVPRAPVTELPPGARLRGPLPRGAVLTEQHVAVDGVADGLRAGRVAVALPLDALPPLTPGQRVDLLAGDPSAGSGRRLAGDATVLAVDEEVVWVEVQRDAAADVVAALAWGDLGVALLPGG